MLRHFLYLNTTALGQYVTALEGGLITGKTMRSSHLGSGSGGLDAKIISSSVSKSHENEESRTLVDSPESQFDRLLKAANSDAESLGWIEVVQPEIDFIGIGIGAMISWECDLFIPQILKTLAQSNELIGMMQTLKPLANDLGLDVNDLPSDETMNNFSQFVKQAKIGSIVVGEDETTDWRIAGELTQDFIHGEVEGPARIVGKVSAVIPKDRWKPYVSFPGMNFMSREERRQRERVGPKPGEENEYLAGPAIMLDLLAIYR